MYFYYINSYLLAEDDNNDEEYDTYDYTTVASNIEYNEEELWKLVETALNNGCRYDVEVADYLVKNYGFIKVKITSAASFKERD
ncbi:hypothetical protein [Clostridium sp. Marseille-Q7071]